VVAGIDCLSRTSVERHVGSSPHLLPRQAKSAWVHIRTLKRQQGCLPYATGQTFLEAAIANGDLHWNTQFESSAPSAGTTAIVRRLLTTVAMSGARQKSGP
jgi:hypothetical protein